MLQQKLRCREEVFEYFPSSSFLYIASGFFIGCQRQGVLIHDRISAQRPERIGCERHKIRDGQAPRHIFDMWG